MLWVWRVNIDALKEPTADINGIYDRNIGITCLSLTHTAYVFIITTKKTNLWEKFAHPGGEISFPKRILWSACMWINMVVVG